MGDGRMDVGLRGIFVKISDSEASIGRMYIDGAKPARLHQPSDDDRHLTTAIRAPIHKVCGLGLLRGEREPIASQDVD